ncbi:MAG: DUF29 domain-containing protein [Pseudomonadales bacterium]|nr:DUF29 domain-containing protein [Pseudomonadales bacterium]
MKAQRIDAAYLLRDSPSLKGRLSDPDWMRVVWARALAQATEETGLDIFPDTCPWSVAQVLADEFYP